MLQLGDLERVPVVWLVGWLKHGPAWFNVEEEIPRLREIGMKEGLSFKTTGPNKWIAAQGFTENFFPLGKNLLACYWSLAETECLTLDHQVTIHSELLIMNWVLSDRASHKVGCAQQYPIIKQAWYIYVIRPKQVLKAQVSHMKKKPKRPWTPLLPQSLAYGLRGSSLRSVSRGRENVDSVYRSDQCVSTTEKWIAASRQCPRRNSITPW